MRMLRASSCEPRAWHKAATLAARSSWLVAFLGMSTILIAQEVHIPLNDGWIFSQAGKGQWYSAEVPGVVQTDLLRHGLIPDFYQGSNIDSVQWIENEDWIYRRTIIATDTLLRHGHLDLVFKGLDTFAEVYLNDSLLGKADNMFRTWEWPVKDRLRTGANELKVIFRSPIKEGAKLRDAYGIQLPHDNDPTGVSPYIRKAAYQFGWDFCPRLVTSGIWQKVELRCWSVARITTVTLRPLPADQGSVRPIWIDAHVATPKGKNIRMRITMDDQLIADRSYREDPFEQMITIDANGYTSWYPHELGEPDLHRLRVTVERRGVLLSEWEKDIGFRTVDLIQKGEGDRSFAFAVNGKPMFARGANVVPPDMLSPNDPGLWLGLVSSARRAGMNMLRIWAGGIYPPEEFFVACDSAGILVWQDFMFANIPPAGKDMVLNVRGESRDQVTRLEGHPSLALWCGNNELDVAWRHWGWQERYGLHGADSLSVAETAENFFGFELPKELGWYGAVLPYTPTSPLSNWGNAEGLKNGDLHYWGVWHGDSAFSSFQNNVGRFVSEYGFQSYPDSALLVKYNDPKELYLGSPTLRRLQRSYKTDKPIWDAIKRELGEEPRTLGAFIEASQEVQAKAYRMAIEAHMAAQPHCMGTLFWQLNDCWPGPSWSLIDFEGRWKPGMYEVQRLYREGR